MTYQPAPSFLSRPKFLMPSVIVAVAVISAAGGYLVAQGKQKAFGAFTGEVIQALCKNAGYDVALYPMYDPGEARCVSSDEYRAMFPAEG